MLFKWSSEFIQECLDTLTEPERKALTLSQLKSGVGKKTLAKYKLTHDEYLSNLESARAKSIEFFEARGISKVADLEFEQPGMSNEARIARSAKDD
jgi:hypothetical protein